VNTGNTDVAEKHVHIGKAAEQSLLWTFGSGRHGRSGKRAKFTRCGLYY